MIPTFQRCGALAHPGALRDTKITALRAQPARPRAVRRTLLWATRLFRHLPDAVLGVVAIDERLAPNRLPIVYRFVLEYFYALDVERELRDRRNLPPIKESTG